MTRRAEFSDVVVDESVLLIIDGNERQLQIRVGRPYNDGSTVWACPCEIVGLESRYPDICGEGPLQALCLALTLVRRRLEHQLERGGTLHGADSREPMTIPPIFGGVGSG